METRTGQPQRAQRLVALRRAEIQTDATCLRRTAHFTDGSTRTVAISWAEVSRVAAFHREVMAQPIACVAISDPARIVVLDEQMEGWNQLINQLPARLALAPSFAEWRGNTATEPPSSHWSILFRAQS
jgi:hypothetical protein